MAKNSNMKAYQVFRGELDKHGRQHYDLIATYLDKERALAHTKQIVESTPLYGDRLVEMEYGDGKNKCWDAIGWEIVTIAQCEEIEITE
jgi:hypothetical protein